MYIYRSNRIPSLLRPSSHPVAPKYNPELQPHGVIHPPGHCPSPYQDLQPPHGTILPPGCCPSPPQLLRKPWFPNPAVPPRPLLFVTLSLTHPSRLPRYYLQGFPNLCFRLLLLPPCIPPDPYPLIPNLLCAYLEYQPQRRPLYQSPLYYYDVGQWRLGSYRFPHTSKYYSTICINTNFDIFWWFLLGFVAIILVLVLFTSF